VTALTHVGAVSGAGTNLGTHVELPIDIGGVRCRSSIEAVDQVGIRTSSGDPTATTEDRPRWAALASARPRCLPSAALRRL